MFEKNKKVKEHRLGFKTVPNVDVVLLFAICQSATKILLNPSVVLFSVLPSSLLFLPPPELPNLVAKRMATYSPLTKSVFNILFC